MFNKRQVLTGFLTISLTLGGCQSPLDKAEDLSKKGKHAEAAAVYGNYVDKVNKYWESGGTNWRMDHIYSGDWQVLARYRRDAGDLNGAVVAAKNAVDLARAEQEPALRNLQLTQSYELLVSLLIAENKLDEAERVANAGYFYLSPEWLVQKCNLGLPCYWSGGQSTENKNTAELLVGLRMAKGDDSLRNDLNAVAIALRPYEEPLSQCNLADDTPRCKLPIHQQALHAVDDSNAFAKNIKQAINTDSGSVQYNNEIDRRIAERDEERSQSDAAWNAVAGVVGAAASARTGTPVTLYGFGGNGGVSTYTPSGGSVETANSTPSGLSTPADSSSCQEGPQCLADSAGHLLSKQT